MFFLLELHVSYSLDQCWILSTHHTPLNHLCSCVATLAIKLVMLQLQVQVSPFGTQHQQEPNCKLLSGATVVQRYLVCASLGFSSPDILETGIFSERTCCTQRSPTAECRTVPNPSLRTIPIAAVASDLIATWPHKQKSFKIDFSPIPSVAAPTAANLHSPLLKVWTPIVLDSTSLLLPLWIFSWSCIQQSLRHQIPQYCCPTRSMHICRSFAGI